MIVGRPPRSEMSESVLSSTFRGSALKSTLTAAKYQSELGMMASEDLRRQWVDMRTQELQRKELVESASAPDLAATATGERTRPKKRKKRRAAAAASGLQSATGGGVLGPVPWSSLPVDSMATEFIKKQDAKRAERAERIERERVAACKGRRK